MLASFTVETQGVTQGMFNVWTSCDLEVLHARCDRVARAMQPGSTLLGVVGESDSGGAIDEGRTRPRAKLIGMRLDSESGTLLATLAASRSRSTPHLHARTRGGAPHAQSKADESSQMRVRVKPFGRWTRLKKSGANSLYFEMGTAIASMTRELGSRVRMLRRSRRADSVELRRERVMKAVFEPMTATERAGVREWAPADATSLDSSTRATQPRRPRPLRYGPYEIGKLLGRGGMASVHIARSIGPHRSNVPLAAKRMHPQMVTTPGYVRMFRKEAQVSLRLVHPNIVRALDFGEQDGELMLVMEYVDGATCSQLKRVAAKRGQGVPVAVAVHVGIEVLRALSYAHGGRSGRVDPLSIVHRDVSPGNILVSAHGQVKLTDFGVVRSDEGFHDTSPGVLKGKFGYMSPEQVAGDDVDGRSDLFSLAAVVFELLTARPLFEGRTAFELLTRMHEADLRALVAARLEHVPLELKLILANALERRPAERFRDAHEFLGALETFARHAALSFGAASTLTWLRSVGVWPAVQQPTTPPGQALAAAATSGNTWGGLPQE